MSEVPDPQELVSVESRLQDVDAGVAVPHDPYGALRHREFVLYVVGSLFAGIGLNMQAVAVGWELYERTGSAMALGWVGFVQVLPILAFAIPAGHMADRFDRRRLIMCGQFLSFVCSCGLVYLSLNRGPVPMIYALLFFNALSRAVSWPASSSFMPQLVPREVFSNAVTWKSTSFQISSVVGPAIGGVLIALFSKVGVVYGVAAGLTFLHFILLGMIRSRITKKSVEPMSIQSVLAGFGFVWRTRTVLAALTLDLFAVLLGGATALLPIYAKDILVVGPTGLGWLRAAPAIGAIVMAMMIAHRPPFQRAGRVLLWAVAGFGVVMIGFGISRSFWVSMVMLAFGGALDNISVVIRHSLVQLSTPDGMRGRVSAVNTVFISCSNELGEFESGTVAALFGPVASVVSGGIGTILVVVFAAKLWPEIKNLKSLQESTAHVP